MGFVRDIIAIANRAITEVRNLGASLFKIQENVESLAKEIKSKKKSEEPAPILRAELEVPETVISYWKSDNTEKGRRERFAIAVNIVALLAIIFYGLVTFELWQEAMRSSDTASEAVEQSRRGRQISEYDTSIQLGILQKQLTAARDSVAAIQRQMRQDQRPWLHISSTGQTVFSINQPLTSSISIANTGKTPAKDIYAVFMLDKVENGNSPNFVIHPNPGASGRKKWFASLKRPRIALYTGDIFPNDPPHELPVQWIRASENGKHTEINILSPSEYQEFSSGKFYFALHGLVIYRDVFGVDHWTQYCTWEVPPVTQNAYTAGECATYSDIDSNN